VSSKRRDESCGVCRLCFAEGELKHSHILPEFLYKPLYDGKHRMLALKAEKASKKPVDLLQKGLREFLLCLECENRLSRLETYASSQLSALPDTSRMPGGEVVRHSGVDYSRFKLFQVSLLWRVGVSKHPTFQEVDLGPHEPRLRQMILDQDPGEAWRYGCVLIRPSGTPATEGLLKPPTRIRCDGHQAYSMVLAGMIWVFVVSSHASKLPGQGSFLSTEGVLTLHVGSKSGDRFLAAVGQKLRWAGLLEAAVVAADLHLL
jgi:hypothetical protein